jgi:hypothetical protein
MIRVIKAKPGMKSWHKNGFFLLVVVLTVILLTGISHSSENTISQQNEPIGEPAAEQLPSPITERKWRTDLRGSVTSLWTFVYTDPENYTLNTNRLRLDGRAFHGENLSFRLIYDIEAFTGNLVSSPVWAHVKNPQGKSYLNFAWGFKPADSVYLRNSIYRALVTYDVNQTRFVLGKQRVAWGVMRFWRPLDMLNTESPLQIEAGEIQGLDAFYARHNLQGQSFLEAVYAPSRFSNHLTTVGKFNIRSGEYDFSVVGGRVRDSSVAGLSFDGYIGSGGFRGELLRISPIGNKNPYFQASIGGDYSFPNNLSLTLEYLYNGGATGEQLITDLLLPPTGFITTRNKHFVGFSAGYQITPLIRGDLFTSYDILGKSTAFTPRIHWNYSENIDFSAGAIFSGGGKSGEYSSYPTTLFTQIRYHF